MNINIKKILICLIIFSCSMFIWQDNGKAETCKYSVNFGERFVNTEEGSVDEKFRQTIENFGYHEKFLEQVTSGRVYPTTMFVQIDYNDNTHNVEYANLVINTNKYSGMNLEMTNDAEFKNVSYEKCPNAIRIDFTCQDAMTSICRWWYNGVDDYSTSWSVSGFDAQSGIFTYPAFEVLIPNISYSEEHEADIINTCNGKTYDSVKIDVGEINRIFDKIPEQIKQSLTKGKTSEIQNRLKTYLHRFSYFNDCSDVSQISNEIQKDAQTLSDFYTAFAQCAKEQDSEVNLKKVEFNGYTYTDIEKLAFLLNDTSESGLSNENNIKTVCERNEYDSMQYEIDEACTNWQELNYSSKKDCKNNIKEDLISQVSCDDALDYFVGGITPNGVEANYSKFLDILVGKYLEGCTGTTQNEQMKCIKNKCNSVKESNDGASKLADEIESNQKTNDNNYSQLATSSGKRVSNISGIKTDTQICDFLYGDDGIGDYIKGALNLIMIGGIIITIILSIMDGIKSFASFKDDESKTFFNHLKVRLICIVLLIIIPTVIKFLVDFVGTSCSNSTI